MSPVSRPFRAHDRLPTDVAATLRTGDGGYLVRVVELSLGGARVELAPRRARGAGPSPVLDLGGALTLELPLQKQRDPLVLFASVAWLEPAGAGRPTRVGLCFQVRSPASVLLLYRLLGALRERAGREGAVPPTP